MKMSKIKLALDIVSDLKALAESIETLVHAMETNDSNPINESLPTNEVIDEPLKETKKRAKTKPASEPVNDEPEVSEETPEEATEQKQTTLEEVRAAMADKSRDGHREAVKAIITKYGANNLSSLDPKHYAVALKEVGELK
jgi:outer membrane biosynthesis protein TonB